jgi:hypothetical protein
MSGRATQVARRFSGREAYHESGRRNAWPGWRRSETRLSLRSTRAAFGDPAYFMLPTASSTALLKCVNMRARWMM